MAKLLKLTKPGTVGVARKYFDEWEFVASEGHEAFKDVPEEEEGDEEEEEGAPQKEKKDTSPTGKMTSFIKQEMAKVYTPYDGDSHSKIFEGPIQHYVRRQCSGVDHTCTLGCAGVCDRQQKGHWRL